MFVPSLNIVCDSFSLSTVPTSVIVPLLTNSNISPSTTSNSLRSFRRYSFEVKGVPS